MKVGDYIRTKNGIIAKIIDNRKNPYGEETIFKLDKEISIYDLELSDMYLTTNPLAEDTTNEIDTHFGDEKTIKKSSPNIIDLIEEGDYVNGVYIDIIEKEQKRVSSSYGDEDVAFYNEDIKSIVTKEQFEAMQYNLESKEE